MKFGKFLIMATVALLFVGCKSAKEVPYMQNIDQIPAESLASVSSQAGDFTMRVGDMLHITVSGSNADAVKPFNKVRYITDISGSNVSVSMGDASTMFYLIDKNGNIDFPVLGKLHVQGMTKSQVEEYIASLICPRYLTEMPNVEVRIQNFRVYCIGDFNSPGVIQAENGRLNLLEAIAMCHDLTLQGRRDNVLLLRTTPTGQRTVTRFNLTDANFITKPEFELQQNDILYVQPNESKARSSWTSPPQLAFGLGLLSTAMSLVTFFTVLGKK